jgi:hypothetical protein
VEGLESSVLPQRRGHVLFSPDENDRTLWAGNFEDYADILVEVEVGMKGTIEKELMRRAKK